MHRVNETFMLRNPASWYDTAVQNIKKTIARVEKVIKASGQGPMRVSLKSQNCIIRASCTENSIAANT